jgi:hypothetical protein
MLKRLSHPLKTSANTRRSNRSTHRARARSYMGALQKPELLDPRAEELIGCYTSVPSARVSASSTSTPR